jgi:hypothetical protein
MKKNTTFSLISFLMMLMSLSTFAQQNYYVSTTGSDANNGTSINEAWQHISYATDKVKAGDIVYVKAGNYGNENVVMTVDGTSENQIIFEGYKDTPGDNPQLNYNLGDDLNSNVMPLLNGGNRAAGTGIDLTNRSYVIVKNFQISNYELGVYAYGAQNVTVDNIIATNFGDINNSYDGSGIVFGSSAYFNTIKNCIVVNAAAELLSVIGDDNVIENCKVYCNENEGNAASDYYITIGGGNRNTIKGCYAERVGNQIHGGHGITLKYNCENNKITDCISKNMRGEGFAVRHRGVKNNIFENCVTYGESGFVVRDGASNNTFRKCRTIGSTYSIQFYDTSEDDGAQYCGRDNVFENCIFENSDIIIDFDSYDQVSPADSNTFVNCTFSGGNYLFNSDRPNNANKMVNCIVEGVKNYSTATNSPIGTYPVNFNYTYTNFWNNGFSTPEGTGNKSENPLFVDAANGNYELKSGSPCIDAGTSNEAPLIDFNNVTRPQGAGFDIGAYEYVDSSVRSSSITTNKTSYNTGESISSTFNGGPGNAKDWIGICNQGTTTYVAWLYVDGTQTGTTGKTNGTVTFNNGLSNTGTYEAVLFENDGMTVLARSAAFTITTNNNNDILVNKGFEEALSTGWTQDWGNNSVDNNIKLKGNNSLKVGPGKGGRAQKITKGYEIGKSYTLSAKMIINNTNAPVNIGAACRLSNGETTYFGTGYLKVANSWETLSTTFTVPANTSSIDIYTWSEGGADYTARVDEYNLVPATANKETSLGSKSITAGSLSSESLSIAPNPNNGSFNVSFDNLEKDNYTLEVNNLLGQSLYKENLTNFSGNISKQLSLQTKEKGVYVITLTNSNNNKISKKIVVN